MATYSKVGQVAHHSGISSYKSGDDRHDFPITDVPHFKDSKHLMGNAMEARLKMEGIDTHLHGREEFTGAGAGIWFSLPMTSGTGNGVGIGI